MASEDPFIMKYRKQVAAPLESIAWETREWEKVMMKCNFKKQICILIIRKTSMYL